MTKFTFTMSDADVSKGIATVSKRAKSTRKDMHSIAVSILHNWAQSGDASTAAARATEMLAIEPAFAQKVVNWFGAYGGLELVETDDKEAFAYTETTIDADTYQSAKAETMFDFTPDAPPKPFDLNAKVLALITQAEKRVSNPVEGDSVSTDVIDALKAALNA